MKRWLLTALVALLVPLLVRGQAPDEKKLDEIVPRALKTFEAPGGQQMPKKHSSELGELFVTWKMN